MTFPRNGYSTRFRPLCSALIVIAATAVVAGCGSDSTSDAHQSNDDDSDVEYAVGGTVSGLESEGLVLQNNGEEKLALDADGSFSFATPLTDGEDYDVTVAEAPINHDCEITNGAGTIDGADVDDVEVACQFDAPPAGVAEFIVDIDKTATVDHVQETQTVEIVATVENRSGFTDEQSVIFSIAGDELESKDVELGAGDTDTLDFEWETSIGDAGDYIAIVSSEYDSGTINVTVDEFDGDLPVYFAISIDTDAGATSVVEGQTVTVVAEVENFGDDSAVQDVEFEIDGDVVDTEEGVSLDSGEATTLQFDWETDIGDEGLYTATVKSDDDSDDIEVEVTASDVDTPADFAVTIDTDAGATSVVEGQTVTVVAEVENFGDDSAVQDVEFKIDGDVVDTEEGVSLDGGEATTLQFDWETDVGDEGLYTAIVGSDDDSDDIEVEVTVSDVDAPADFAVTIDEASSTLEVEQGDTVIVDVTVTNDGDDNDTQDVELLVGGEVEDVDADLELDGGQSQQLSLQWETTSDDGGYHSAEVRSDDDADTVTVTVGEPDDDDATVTGTVTDASTGGNLEGVDVMLFEDGAATPIDHDTTGAAGAYSFADVEPGDYDIELKAPGLEPNYEIEQAGGDTVLSLSIAGGLVEQDLTVEWLRTTDLIIDGGILAFDDGSDSFAVPFPGCEKNDDGSWEPEDIDFDDDVELTFDPDDECYRIDNVAIDIATGVFTASASDVVFPTIEVYMEDDENDEIDAIDVELEWLIDDVGGQVDFTDGAMDVDLDLRILVGGTAYALLNLDFGARAGDLDCQLTGAWGGDIDNPQADTTGQQVGDYLHDPIALRLTTEQSGTAGNQGVPYDPNTGLVIAIDHEVAVDRISEGPIGNNDPGGAACGDIDLFGNQADFARELNDLLELPAGPGDVLLDFNLWVD